MSYKKTIVLSCCVTASMVIIVLATYSYVTDEQLATAIAIGALIANLVGLLAVLSWAAWKAQGD